MKNWKKDYERLIGGLNTGNENDDDDDMNDSDDMNENEDGKPEGEDSDDEFK